MRPYIVTESQAGKLPRWGLFLLCALYILPGLLGRDPWRAVDAADFGVSLTLARGTFADWLVPNLAGEPAFDRGPLPFWVTAGAARALFMMPEHLAVRLTTAALLALMFVSFWYAVYWLARRPSLQPSDPFGASASPVDFGRALADSGLLILMASFGLLVKLHETTAASAQVIAIGVYLMGAALSLDRPLRGGLIVGVSIAALALTEHWPHALALLVGLPILCLLSQPYRIVARTFLPASVITAIVLAAAWPLTLYWLGDPYWAYAQRWLLLPIEAGTLPGANALMYLIRTAPWFFWPAWPIAAWALVRWRHQLTEPGLALPLISLVLLAIATVLPNADQAGILLPMAPPIAVLAAIGLPSLRRAVVNLIDWFSVTVFTLFGIVVWAYWLAWIADAPAKMAYRASQIAMGARPGLVVFELVLGIAASVAWLALVRWRISRQPPMIWRAVVLSCGGLVLAWFLLMTLWLPAFNQRLSYRDLAERITAELKEPYDCVESRDLPGAERASLAYFGRVRFAETAPSFEARSCQYLLAFDSGPISEMPMPNEVGWQEVTEFRQAHEPLQRIRLYRRAAGQQRPR